MTGVLKVLKVFGAWFPFGPVENPPTAPFALQVGCNKDGDDKRSVAELAQDYKGFLKLLEKELVAIAGLVAKDAEKTPAQRRRAAVCLG